jgi:hypothetical protein
MEVSMNYPQTSVPALISRLEASKKLRCSLATFDRLGIEHVKIRRRKYYRQETITAWILAQESKSRRQP